MTESNLYPLSLPQEAFYFDYLLNRNDTKYNMGGALILDGDLDVELYRKAYNYAIKHFDAMRIKFVKRGETLYQQFKEKYECEIKYYDFREHKNSIEEAIKFILEEYKKPLPIENGELISEMILRIEDKKYIFAPKFHHMIFDAFGRSIVNQAISDTYNSLLENNSYPELKPFSYIDFINDDLHYRDSELYKKSFEYWKQKFEKLPETFEFTLKKKSIKNISLHTERVALNLHRLVFESIVNIAFDTNTTPFQVILGLIAVTLNKCYKRDEMIIGMPSLNRSNYKFRNTPGLFMNMMALKIKIDAGKTFADIVGSIKSEAREGYRHQRFPLRDTIKYLRRNSKSNNELFDVTVIYRKNDYSQRFGEGKLHSITFDTEVRSESLSIEIDEYDEKDNVNIFFNYNPQVISDDEMIQFVRCFETILMDVTSFPEKSIKELKLLNDFDAHKILNEFNHSPEKLITQKTVVEMFEEAVEKYPGNDAVICDEKIIGYKELNEKANRVANYLLANFNIQREEIICMAADRSVDAIAAMLGIMKTGAAYLPVDPEYPVERIKYILKNSGARIFIKSGLIEAGLAENEIKLDEINSPAKDNPFLKIKPNNLAYVIYTSGSTGKPKGVLIEHAQFTNMFVNMIGKFAVKETDRVLQFASPGFDASVFEIFQALLTGAALVIADKEKILNTQSFIKYLNEKKVTVATLPPVYLKALDKSELPSINTLITAGEQAAAQDVNFYKNFKRYINAYGPTEASVCSSYYIAEKDIEYNGIVPIGKPSPNSRLYILDENLEPVPVGFTGELCISGPSVARGYLNNEELTKQKFIDNPFVPGERLYLTGDLARWKKDGNIELLGRVDEQVKIDGNRIELGEIESLLIKYDKVKEAVVLDISRKNVKELAAFIVPKRNTEAEELKIHLRKFLPRYMIPHHYKFIETIPLTQNGKIDKEALRKLPLDFPLKKAEFQAATGEIESKLISMFEEVLDVSPVSVNDNFFELGGESLKIARLISKIYKELKREIDFKTIFDNPTVKGIAAELETASITEYEEIPAARSKDYYSLSHAQKRIWILSQNKNSSAVYHMPVSLLLEGKLDIEILEKSFKIIVDRHESLHTVFIEVNGTPNQKILQSYSLDFQRHDLTENSDRIQSAQKIIKEKITVPFNLATDIPVRINILKLEREKHLLLLVLHHIAGDGISIGIILDELSLLYNSFIKENDPSLKPLRIQYKDYSEYEHEIVKGEKYEDEKKYWLQKLKSPLPVLDLVYDKPRPPIKTYAGDYLFYEIEDNIFDKLIEFCKAQNISINVLITAVVNILLHKYSSQEEIIVASPVAGRNLPGLENQVGVYINTVPLRSYVNSGSTISEFITGVKENLTEAISNGDYPFDSLIQSLDIERDTSRTPVFDVLIQYQNRDLTELKLSGVSSAFFETEFKLNKFDLTFTFAEEGSKLKFSIGYNTDLFNKARIDSAALHISNILNYVLKNPEGKIKEICLTGAAETENLRKISSGSRKDFDKSLTISQLFEKQADKTPENIALIFNERKYTYQELDRQANLIANDIKSRTEVKQDEVIGIMTSRSELMIIGILGILKAGGAYMPIDSGYPVERINFMLSDSKVKVLLTENNSEGIEKKITGLLNSSSFPETELIDISNLSGSNDTRPEQDIASSNLAYVIYTSGSTGKPKGVMIEHRSLHNLVLGLSGSVYGKQPDPLKVALVAPFVFDASVKQIFYALLNGHCLDIVPEEVKTSGKKLLEYYAVHEINVSDGTPVHLEILLDELNTANKKFLPDRMVIGGQQLLYQTVKKIFDITGDYFPVITNVYGPTECCDVSTCFNISGSFFKDSEGKYNFLPVGKPLNNVYVLILDDNLARVPVGVRGELCIAGEGLARGYVNQPLLTKEKFIAQSPVDGKRIYRTGDLGYYLPDGNIVLSGRTDDQVKIRGFRIELSEIENCIRDYDKINSTAVIQVGGNNPEIAAYYCASENVDDNELRNFLSQHLPDYMIPAYFISLEHLPLTINGKVDKKALPVPLKENKIDKSAPSPQDTLEEKLCEIWKDLLNVNHVNMTDNFFKLGGHSLIAIRLTSKILKEFGTEINIWEVFQHPTIASIAKLIRGKEHALFRRIEKVEESGYYPVSHSQRRLWFLSKLEGQNSLYNLPGAFLLKGRLNIPVLEKAFKAIVQRHESFRTYFVEIDGEPFQKIVDNVDFKIVISDFKSIEPEENQLIKIANESFRKEFDLAKVPLFEIKLILFSGDKYLLLFNMHHIISDGWSIDVMVKELERYYNIHSTNNQPSLPPLKIQYKDYAAWQNRILHDQSLDLIKEYWHKKLCKPHPLLDLPLDFKRPEILSTDGSLIHFMLDSESAEALAEISGSQNASLFMILLSAVYVLLNKYSGDEDIMLGSPVAGRQHYDLENQIGFYINTLVLRNDVNPEDSFIEFLNKVKTTLSEAIDRQVYPFDKLVDELDVERIRNRNPLFDVMVAWMVKNGMDMKFNLGSVEAKAMKFSMTKSMFDLSFLFAEEKGGISFAIEYNTSLFKRVRIQRMAEHFKTVIKSITANPNEKLKNLEMLTAAEKEEILLKLKNKSSWLSTDKNVIGLLNETAELNENNAALVYEGKKLTYGELDKLSNRIANHLIEKVEPKKDDIIPVIVDDPILAAASMIAVMKTGAAYLPIASDNPPERIKFIIKDSNAKVLLTDNVSFANCGSTNDCVVIEVSDSMIGKDTSPEVQITQDDLAYVIYTSGSTGLPKGVMIEHGSLSNLVSSLNKNVYSQYKNSLRELMITSFAFDVSIKQILAVLCSGNTLHILNKEKRLDPREIIKYIDEHEINIVDLTPSLFSVMLDEGFAGAVKPGLKEIFLGSEALPFKLVKNFYGVEANREINITNFYGPTECCVESSYFKCHTGLLNEDYDITPIGKPAANQEIFIMDKHNNLCPDGNPGEICIAGKGLARSYLNDPERTSEKFILAEELKGTRIYKTGDMGRIQEDGNIEFLGRIDEQVKLRGFRIELKEIEKRLLELEEVKDCVVILLGDNSSGKLTAYYTSQKKVESAELKKHLEHFLPKYMIPVGFIQLERIPLSANGKVNKKLLPEPTVNHHKVKSRLPQNEVEESILKICSDVLMRDETDLDDNFFEIGGHSLNAVKLISKIQKEWNVDLGLNEIFYNPVLFDIAEIVKNLIEGKNGDNREKNDDEDIIVPISEEELNLLSNLNFDDED